ncbi:MAG: hypothetical protein IRY99_26515, partial [Isosphaeraceae bacterium]|nr:hypothetical protein [Isosphaeraceae bacterium]
LWPGRLAGLPPALASALAEAPPVVWWGRREEEMVLDKIRLAGLHDVVRRFLDRLPLAAPRP